MVDFTPKKIQQQMYTRERRGIFRSTEGFDTIAKSPGLDQAFIKKVLHPFCQYDAPAELTARGEKDVHSYPDAVHLFHTEAGETVLGRSVYQPADFTGLRSAFFTHNFVIPAEGKEDAKADYRDWLNASFQDRYDIEQGTDIPELNAIPTHEGGAAGLSPDGALALLEELHIDERVFKQLLFAAMASASGKKKVYIVLDVPVEQLSFKAKQLLGVLFGSLPYELRRQLGFLTYAKEPQSKKGIDLMFVEKGSLRLNDRSIEKDYLFELAARRVINVELDWSKQPYLDFAWLNLRHPQRAESFFQFAELMLSDMEPIRGTSMASYHELCVLYQIEEGNEQLYVNHKSAVLRGILEYLAPPGALNSKIRLNELFLARFDLEFDRVKEGEPPEADIIECIKDYYSINSKNYERKIVEYFIRSLNNTISQNRKDLTQAIYAMIESSQALSRAFFARVLTNPGLPPLLFEPYIDGRFKKASKARDIVDLAGGWVRTHPVVLENGPFAKLAETQLVDKLRYEPEPVKAVNAVLDQLDKLDRDPHRGLGSVEGGSQFVDRLMYAANLFLLTDVNLDTLSKEELLNIGFLQEAKEFKSWVTRFDSRIRSKAAVMLAAYQWFSSSRPEGDVFAGLSPVERDQVQHIGRGWLKKEVEPSKFEAITLAFCQDVETGAIDYGSLLDYIHKYGPNPEMVYKYIQWSANQPLFVRPRGLVPAYAAAIVSYFKRNDQGAFKNKDYVKKYFDNALPVLKPVYAKARNELASPWLKFFRRNRKPMMFSSLLLLIVLVGGTLLIMQANGAFKKTADTVDVTKTPVKSPPTVPEVVKEVPVLTANQVKTADKGNLTELTFHFKQPAVCRGFQASEVTVVGKDESILLEAVDPELESKCAEDPGAGTETTDGSATVGDQTGTDEKADPGKDTAGKAGTDESESVTTDSEEATTEKTDSAGAQQKKTGDAGTKDDTGNASNPGAAGKGDEGNTGSTGSTSNGTPGAQGDSTHNQEEYTSTVTVKLGKKLDLTKIDKVIVDGESYVLTADIQQSTTTITGDKQGTDKK